MINKIPLQTCDVLVCINDRKDLFSRIKRAAMGRYEHVEMYLGDTFHKIPLMVESDNRGVVIQSMKHQEGRHVRVMRVSSILLVEVACNAGKVNLNKLVKTAVQIASDSRSYYDWFGLVRFAALRVLRNKFGITRPLTYRYKRDPKMICSEAVAEIFWRNKMEILPRDLTPIPADFAFSNHLIYIGEGFLAGDSIKL